MLFLFVFQEDLGQPPMMLVSSFRDLYMAWQWQHAYVEHLWKALKEEGPVQSKQDAYLLFCHALIVIYFLDNLGIQDPNMNVITDLMQNLKLKGFEMTMEDTFSVHLGIQYNKRDDGSILISHPGLIKRILSATNMHEYNVNFTPSMKEALGSDPNIKLMKESWNYFSVAGMLLYLSINTHPDKSFVEAGSIIQS